MNHPKRFSQAVVVGSGPSAFGKGWGRAIDSSDTVIRLTEQLDYNEEDYGKKFTYGFYQVAPKFVRLIQREPPSREPTLGWVASYLKGEEFEYGETIARVCQRDWVAEAKELLPYADRGRELRLTRGCVAACWAIESCVPRGTIVLVGFDFVHQGYCQGGKFGPYPALRWRKHNFSVERPFLTKLADRHHVNLYFAQDIWK